AIIWNDFVGLPAVTFLAETCAVLDDRRRAAPLYELLAPFARFWMLWSEGLFLGPATHFLGLLARTMGRLDEAAAHFERAVAETRRVGARPFLARALHEYAVLLRRRGGPGDAEQAETMLAEAGGIATAIGMEGLVRKVAALTGAAPALPHSEVPVPEPPASQNRFRKAGDLR